MQLFVSRYRGDSNRQQLHFRLHFLSFSKVELVGGCSWTGSALLFEILQSSLAIGSAQSSSFYSEWLLWLQISQIHRPLVRLWSNRQELLMSMIHFVFVRNSLHLKLNELFKNTRTWSRLIKPDRTSCWLISTPPHKNSWSGSLRTATIQGWTFASTSLCLESSISLFPDLLSSEELFPSEPNANITARMMTARKA